MRIATHTITLLSVFLLVAAIGAPHACADDSEQHDWTIWDLPSIPEHDIDIGYWALVIAKECDSSVDIDRYLDTLDTMAAAIRHMVGPREGDMVRFVMTKMYQFDPGEWNNFKTFSYNLDDPMGEQPGARLLSTYLDTGEGNCVSMPTLFLALMERVDRSIPFNGVSAPMHLFCRLYDRQDGRTWNVEATNGGNSMRDEWVRQQFGASQAAIDSGTYLRTLSKREYVAELIGSIVSKYRKSEDYKTASQYADLMLELNPRSLTGLVQKGAILGWLGHTLQQSILAERRPPTESEMEKLELYKVKSDSVIERARALGWEPETPQSREKYLQTISNVKMGITE